MSAIHILTIFVFYISSFLRCFRLEGISSPHYYPFGSKVESLSILFPFRYNEICVGRFLRNYPYGIKRLMSFSIDADRFNNMTAFDLRNKINK